MTKKKATGKKKAKAKVKAKAKKTASKKAPPRAALDKNQIWKVNDIAEILNVSDRWIQKLSKEGVIPKPVKGEYELGATVKAYVGFLQGKVSGDEVAQVRKAVEDEKLRKIRLENDAREGNVIYVDEARHIINEMAASVKLFTNSIPGRMANELAIVSEPAIIKKMLLNEIRSAQESISVQLESATTSAKRSGHNKATTRPGPKPVGGRKSRTATGKRGTRAI